MEYKWCVECNQSKVYTLRINIYDPYLQLKDMHDRIFVFLCIGGVSSLVYRLPGQIFLL